MRRFAARTAVLAVLASLASPVRADDASAPSSPADAATEPACTDGGGPACPVFARYLNEKYAFSVDVPAFLARRGADADGRGQPFSFASGGKKIKVRAWAMFNAPVMTVDQLFGDWSRRGRVSFKAVAGNTWVVRGTENGQLFYMRSVLSEGIITTIEAVYDPAFEDDFEPVLARMGASLLPIPGKGVRPRTQLTTGR